MDDLISRQAAIDRINGTAYAEQIKENMIFILRMLPYVQSEIIRCKDCKHARMTNDGECKYCDIWFPDEAEYLDGDYYCASAERRES